MHPAGEEFVYLLFGQVDFVLNQSETECLVTLDNPGDYALVPAGWHTARVCPLSSLLFITPGEGAPFSVDTGFRKVMRSPVHTILWRRIDLPGHDVCHLWKSTTGWQLSGTAIFLFEQTPCHLAYEVNADTEWRTCIARVSGYVGRSAIDFAIASTTSRCWSMNGVEVQAVAGCIDLDLGFTPATNLIAIRRLSLAVGEQSPAPAAWLNFPDFKLEWLEQQYHRLSDCQYRYTAPDVGYADVLEVNGDGAVTRYPELWQQENED